MHHKRNLFFLISAVVICVIGICYYGFRYNKKGTVKVNNTKVKDGIVYAQYKDNQVSKDKIKTVKRADNILALSNNKMIFNLGKMIKSLDIKTDKRELLKYIGDNDDLIGICSDGNITAWIEDQRLENFEEDGRCLYYKKYHRPTIH